MSQLTSYVLHLKFVISTQRTPNHLKLNLIEFIRLNSLGFGNNIADKVYNFIMLRSGNRSVKGDREKGGKCKKVTEDISVTIANVNKTQNGRKANNLKAVK